MRLLALAVLIAYSVSCLSVATPLTRDQTCGRIACSIEFVDDAHVSLLQADVKSQVQHALRPSRGRSEHRGPPASRSGAPVSLITEALDSDLLAEGRLRGRTRHVLNISQADQVWQDSRLPITGCRSAACICQKLLPVGSRRLFAPVCLLWLAVIFWGIVGAGSKAVSPTAYADANSWWRTQCCCFWILSALVILFALTGLHFGLRGHLQLVHIPKTAGTSIELAGFSQGIDWGSKNLDLKGRQDMPDGSVCNRYHVPPSLLTGTNPYRSSTMFCVTRNPYDRALSEYRYMLSVPWGHEYETKYQNGIFNFAECSPDGLNHFVQRTLTLYKAGFRFIDDCHHVPQTQYITKDDGGLECSIILRLEDMPSSFDNLMKEKGYPITIGGMHALDSAGKCKNLTTEALSLQTREMLQEVYAEDFRRLNYSM